MHVKQVRVYRTQNNKEPFNDWLKNIKQTQDQMRIRQRIDRLSLGNYGDCKLISKNLYELRCHFSSGYRIYFTERNQDIVVLLIGGNKNTQAKDIEKAKAYLNNFEERSYE